jgi:hypothetical protein
MQSNQAAQIFHDWAFEEGFMPEGPRAPIASSAADRAKITPVTDAGKQTLRSKLVDAVAFNDQRGEITVFLKRAAPVSKKALSLLPSVIEDVAIKYRQGVPEPVGPAANVPFGGPSYVVRAGAGADRYTCGSSISCGNFRDAGTLGALVRNVQGDLFGLSNNHVTGQCSHAEIGLPIVAPGIYDVAARGLPPFTLGYHALALAMVGGTADNIDHKKNLDAAIFRIQNESLVTSYQRTYYDTPAGTAALVPNMVVEKVGRTTGHTTGVVTGQLFGATPINYSMALHGFAGAVSFEPMFSIIGQTTVFSENGDSGSLIITTDSSGQRKAVGIVVGGGHEPQAPGQYRTLALAIEPILAALQVTLVSGHNI